MVAIAALLAFSAIAPALSSPFFYKPAISLNESSLSKRALPLYDVSSTAAGSASNGNTYTLGAACPFSVTGKTGISNVGTSLVFAAGTLGYIGVSPITIAAITGMTSANAPAGMSGPGLTIPGNADNAVLAASNAYTAYSNMKVDYADVQGGQLTDGTHLAPGVYKWSSTVVIPVGATIYLDGKCGDQFVFIATGAISTGANSKVVFATTGATAGTAASVFWVGATSVTTGVSSEFLGIILTYTNVVIAGNLIGMVYTQTEVALHFAKITRPGTCTKDSSTFGLECDPTNLNGLVASGSGGSQPTCTEFSAALSAAKQSYSDALKAADAAFAKTLTAQITFTKNSCT